MTSKAIKEMITKTKGWYLLLSESKNISELELIIKIKKKTVKNFTLILFTVDDLINKIDRKMKAANKLATDTEVSKSITVKLQSLLGAAFLTDFSTEQSKVQYLSFF